MASSRKRAIRPSVRESGILAGRGRQAASAPATARQDGQRHRPPPMYTHNLIPQRGMATSGDVSHQIEVPCPTPSVSFSTKNIRRSSGTTLSPTCPRRLRRCCIRARSSQSARAIWHRCFPWRSSCRRCRRNGTWRFPSPSATFIGSGGPARCIARGGWNRRWIRRRRSTTNTRASARPAVTSPTPRCPRPSITRKRASRASPRKRARASGDRRWPSRERYSASTCRCSWCAFPTIRSPIGGR